MQNNRVLVRLAIVLALFLIAFGAIYSWMCSPNWIYEAGWLCGFLVLVIPFLAIVFYALCPLIGLILWAIGYDGGGPNFLLLLKALAVAAFAIWIIVRLVH